MRKKRKKKRTRMMRRMKTKKATSKWPTSRQHRSPRLANARRNRSMSSPTRTRSPRMRRTQLTGMRLRLQPHRWTMAFHIQEYAPPTPFPHLSHVLCYTT
jgi:hypothetical protein